MSNPAQTPQISWDFGTAYEFLISLHVLHNPTHYGIRPSYAAGVRSRIPAAERKLLEDVMPMINAPLSWTYNLPAPKDAISALWAFKQIPPAERMIKLMELDTPCDDLDPTAREKHENYNRLLLQIATEGKWKTNDIDAITKLFGKKETAKKEDLERFFERWSKPTELGEGFLSALQAYYQSFFEEEEKRVLPFLQTSLEKAKALAISLEFDELFDTLSQGVQLNDESRAPKYIFVPAFWTTPLIFFNKLDNETMMILFGARPADTSVVPGETLPDGLVRSLKALADPTRLKILYYLSHEDLTPSELARRLHLRAPTVTHHLSELRLASLVNVIVDGQEKKYTARHEALQATFTNLQNFLDTKE